MIRQTIANMCKSDRNSILGHRWTGDLHGDLFAWIKMSVLEMCCCTWTPRVQQERAGGHTGRPDVDACLQGWQEIKTPNTACLTGTELYLVIMVYFLRIEHDVCWPYRLISAPPLNVIPNNMSKLACSVGFSQPDWRLIYYFSAVSLLFLLKCRVIVQ